MKITQFRIEDDMCSYQVEGQTEFGDSRVLVNEDDDLTQGTLWADAGFTVEPFLSSRELSVVINGIKNQLFTKMKKLDLLDGKVAQAEGLDLKNYHQIIDTNEKHASLIRETREGFPVDLFPGGVDVVENRISKICGISLTSICPSLNRGGYFIRIIRPNVKGDNNPPHRDVYLNHLRNAINIYVPIAGSTIRSSLPMVPGSHRWPESEIERTVQDTKVDGASYTVSAVTGSRRSINMIRPNPKHDEVLVFSPYLIHGGGINLNTDFSRMSLEMRFWRK